LRVSISSRCFLSSSALATACCAKATTMYITNCEYIAQFFELNDTAMSIISNSQQGQPIQYVFQDYRNYQYSASLANAVTTITMPIPAKFASLIIESCTQTLVNHGYTDAATVLETEYAEDWQKMEFPEI
jgi:hypothetical protein